METITSVVGKVRGLILFLAVGSMVAAAADLTPAERAKHEETIQIYTSSVIPQNPKDPAYQETLQAAHDAQARHAESGSKPVNAPPK